MVSDLFHLFPTHETVNGARSNYPFNGITDSQTDKWYIVNGDNSGLTVLTSIPTSNIDDYSELKSNTEFEPREDHKGDAARAIFYFYTMYPTQAGAITDLANLDTLYKWHTDDPVNAWEDQRNDRVENKQGNRNPYIDYPDIACRAWGITCPSSGLQFTSSPVTEATVNQKYTYNVTFEGDNAQITATTIPDWLSLTDATSTTAKLSGVASSANSGANSVVLSISDSKQSVTQEFDINVTNGTGKEIINVDFSECLPSGWTTYSVSGSKDWGCDSEFLNINAYGGTGACNDWFISDELNLDAYTNENLTFKTWTRYTDTEHPRLKIKYSTDYTGSGNPESATWTNLNYTYPDANSQEWINSGDIDLSAVSGSSVYLAYQYTSSGTSGGSSTYWKLDDILLTGDNANPPGDWTGNVSSDWNDKNNWGNLELPTNETNIVLDASAGNSLNIDEATSCLNVIVKDGGSLTITGGGDLTVNGDFSNGGGTSGSYIINDGTCTVTGDYYTETGSTTNISGGTFDITNWQQSSTNNWAKGNINLSGGVVKISQSAYFDSNNLSGSMTGNFVMNVGNNLYLESSAWTTITGGTINMTGSYDSYSKILSATSGGIFAVYNLTLNDEAGQGFGFCRDNSNGSIDIKNNFTIQNGTAYFTNGNYKVQNCTIKNVIIESNGTLNCDGTNDADLNISGSWTNNGGTFTSGTNTVKFTNNSGTYNIKTNSSFYNVIFEGGAVWRLISNFDFL